MVGLVLVSHSDAIVRGLRDLLDQMEDEVAVGIAGGTDDGGLGTSFDLVNAAFDEADTGDGAVVLFDLGSAEMTAEQALEFLDDERRDHFVVVDAPLIEGALAAAGVAAGGGDLRAVADAARSVGAQAQRSGGAEPSDARAEEDLDRSVELRLRNQHGLHARPAGKVVKALRDLDATVRIERTDTGDDADATSLLSLVGLGAPAGTTVRVRAGGDDAETALARVRELVEDLFGEPPADTDAPGADADGGSRAVDGDGDEGGGPRPGADGLALGPVRWLHSPEPDLPDDGDTGDEARDRLARARRQVRADLEGAGGEGADILAAQAEVLDDPTLVDAVAERLDDGAPAARAWWAAVRAQRDRLADLPDEVFAARAADVDDVGRRVLARLGVDTGRIEVDEGDVVLADDLTPAQMQRIHAAGAAGAVVRHGTPTAHMAIMARNLGVPLVLRAGRLLDDIAAGDLVFLDGGDGAVEVGPSEERRAELRDQIDARHERLERQRQAARRPVTRADGTRIEVAANVASVREAELAVAHGADGVGLLRTEFLFGDRPSPPDEDEQVEALAPILDALDGRPAIVRTLDIGGDKPSAALDLDPVRNGFLGVRGLRLSLREPELFRTQLRALLRLADRYEIAVMFPFVTAVDEITAARDHLDRARDELVEVGRPAGRPTAVGMMVEIPVAALDPEPFLAHVDFLSVGTNDLAQYLAAAGRTIDEVSDLTDRTRPAVHRLVADLCRVADGAGRWVGVCGELAADPDAATRFVEDGVTELSMAPAAIPTVKETLLRVVSS